MVVFGEGHELKSCRKHHKHRGYRWGSLVPGDRLSENVTKQVTGGELRVHA
jgi:hypothetical protein